MADTPRRRRWLTWALVASLGLNLIGVGIIGGAIIKGPPPGPMPGFSLWRYGHALPDPYRRDLGKALRQSARDWAGPRETLRGQPQAMAAALTADPFDPAAVEATLDRQAEMLGELTARGSALLIAQITRMSPEDRAAYAAALLAEQDKRRAKRGSRRD
jgi:uncharacterized membrane protein